MKNSQTPREANRGSAELHINYWKIPKSSNTYNRFVDFGVMINDVASEIDKVYFYFPFDITSDDLEDLGGKLKESSLLCTLFNSDYIINNIPNSPSYYEITTYNSDRDSFLLYELGKSNFKLKSMSPNKGVLLSISIKSLPINSSVPTKKGDGNNRNLYFRFRLSNIPKETFFHEEEVSNDFFQSAFSKTEMLSFRINDIRELDKKVYEEISSIGNFILFNKVHFFFIGSSEDEKVDGNSNYNDCRLLDSGRWKPYLFGLDLSKRKCIAYHWSFKATSSSELLDKCNIFLRTVYKSSNIKKILVYSSVVVGLGVLGSLISSLIIWLFK